jgi:predicted permease
MISFHVMKAVIRRLLLRHRLNQQLDEELHAHIALLVEEEMDRGISEAEARRRARLQFGGLEQTREAAYDARALQIESFWKDLCYAWRRVLSTPLFSIFAVATLALGIGATTAIYSIIRSVLQPPPGVKNIESIINIYHCPVFSGSIPIIGLSYGDYLDLRSRQTVFQDVTAWHPFQPSFAANGHAQTSVGEIVEGSYFRVLGVNAQQGRTLQPADDKPGAPPVVVISHSLWQHVFGGRPGIVGQILKINGRIFEIVGVIPAEFCGLSGGGKIRSSLWIPLGSVSQFLAELHIGSLDTNERSHRWLLVKGLLKPGHTVADATAEVKVLGKQLDLAYPIGKDLPAPGPGWRLPLFDTSRQWSVRRAADIRIDDSVDAVVGPMVWAIMTAVVLVLLVACSNIANLMLARASGRRHDLAVRLALGASRWNLIRSLLAECSILAVAGGIVGIGVAHMLFLFLGNDINIVNGVSLHFEPRLDTAALIAAALATMLSLIVAGLAPALQSTRADLRSALATDASHGTRPRWRGRSILITTQVAVSVVLLSIMALYINDVRRQNRRNSGFDLEPLALAEIDFTEQGYEETRVRQIANVVLEQMERKPDVDAAAVSSGLPVGVTTPGCMLKSPDNAKRRIYAQFVAGTPGLFRTLGISILHGRAFDNRDTKGSEPVVVVNETTARKLFGTIDAVGREVNLQRSTWVGEKEHSMETMRIIGVAEDSDSGSVGRRNDGVVYLPFDQHYEGRLVFSARARRNPEELVGALRQSLRSIEPEAAVTQAGTGPAIAGPSVLYAQIMASLAGSLGSLALVLALAGLYGVLSHVVSRRTWEIGVRMTLGADRSGVIRMVLWDGLRPVIYGIIVGSIVGILAQKLIRPQFRPLAELLPPQNMAVLFSVPLLLLVAACIACALPARRAASINPNSALREL